MNAIVTNLVEKLVEYIQPQAPAVANEIIGKNIFTNVKHIVTISFLLREETAIQEFSNKCYEKYGLNKENAHQIKQMEDDLRSVFEKFEGIGE